MSKLYIPKDFSFNWVKLTSIKYNLVDKNNNIEVPLLFSTIFFILYTLFTCYYDILVLDLGDIHDNIIVFVNSIIPSIFFFLNFYFYLKNIDCLQKISKLLNKRAFAKEVEDLKLLRSFYRLQSFINIVIAFVMFIPYIYILVFNNVLVIEKAYEVENLYYITINFFSTIIRKLYLYFFF